MVVFRLPCDHHELLLVVTLPATSWNVLVDAVEGFQHDDRTSRDDYHADAHLLAVSLPPRRVVETDATISIAAIAGAAVAVV